MIELYKSLTISQFIAALETLRQSIDRCDDETWAADHLDGAVNQVVFHTLFYADLYLNSSPEGFEQQQFHLDRADFFRDYEEREPRKPVNFYDKTTSLEYLEFCEGKVRSVINGESDETLRGESGFSWRKCPRAELHVYNLRHVQHHAAQLGLRHQLLGGEPLKWVGEG